MQCSKTSVLSALLLASAASADGSVTIGPTYEIAEPDALQEIQDKAKAIDWQARIDAREPEDYSAFQSAALPRAKADRSFLFDPTYTLPRDIVDGQGRVIWPAGTRVNVYERVQTTTRTIVIGDDPAHYRWLDEVARPEEGDRVYLAGGNVLLRMRAQQRQLFLLEDRVIERFGLEAVPAIVEQEGNQLRVTEYEVVDR